MSSLSPGAAPLIPDHSEEQTWVAHIRAGDVAAFEALFRTYYTPLWRFVVGQVGQSDAARDIVQDLFAEVWARRTTWVIERSVATYLYGAARNRALNYLRRARVADQWERRATANGSDVSVMGRPIPAPDETFDRSETMQHVRRAVATLPERQRQALTLRWFHGLSHQEISDVLGVSVKGVESLMSRSMATLRAVLKPRAT